MWKFQHSSMKTQPSSQKIMSCYVDVIFSFYTLLGYEPNNGCLRHFKSYIPLIAMFLVRSLIIIMVPTRGLLAVDTMHAIVQWLANLNIKRHITSMFVNKNIAIIRGPLQTNFLSNTRKTVKYIGQKSGENWRKPANRTRRQNRKTAFFLSAKTAENGDQKFTLVPEVFLIFLRMRESACESCERVAKRWTWVAKEKSIKTSGTRVSKTGQMHNTENHNTPLLLQIIKLCW